MKKLILIMVALFSMSVMSCGKGAGQSSASDTDSVDTAQVDTIDSVQVDTVAADSLVK